ncbi:hypothetical protein RA2_04396 [Roseovarius sp. A-2]|uniref:hypothetical protein n=1 Tax=Roseovarius sp. A-2 TaxID=1570360 RepID=UPI0009D44B08|nr:hypothetical protein [Roseovarius sp. A-2]GAW37319.1 hypothetical protein RA2_04396 [Roseovarius sp. A-2]
MKTTRTLAVRNRFAQAARVLSSAGASIRIGARPSSVRATAVPRAPEDVSMCSKVGQMRSASAMTPSPAATRSNFRTAFISRITAFSRSVAFAVPRQPNAPARTPGLNAHLCVVRLATSSPLSGRHCHKAVPG